MNQLEIWTIYEHPTDYPDKFVVRRWVIGAVRGVPCAFVVPLLANTLEEARNFIPAGMFRLDPMPGDEPQIVESWI